MSTVGVWGFASTNASGAGVKSAGLSRPREGRGEWGQVGERIATKPPLCFWKAFFSIKLGFPSEKCNSIDGINSSAPDKFNSLNNL